MTNTNFSIEFSKLGISKEEFEDYLTKYQSAKYFTTIKAGGECLNVELVNAITTLYKLDLLPILLHGGGKQIDIALKEKGLASEKIDGIRVTDEKTLDVVVSTLNSINKNLVSEMNRERKVAKGINDAFYVDGPNRIHGYVGNVTGINEFAINKCLEQKLMPIISSLGLDDEGRYSNPNADSAYKSLVATLKPLKIIILTSVGGVYEEHKIISEMNGTDLREFIDSRFVSGGMRVKLKEAKAIVDLGFDVQITNPKNLIKELFSKKGHGTYIHR